MDGEVALGLDLVRPADVVAVVAHLRILDDELVPTASQVLHLIPADDPGQGHRRSGQSRQRCNSALSRPRLLINPSRCRVISPLSLSKL